jgi:hypothetical protein
MIEPASGTVARALLIVRHGDEEEPVPESEPFEPST